MGKLKKSTKNFSAKGNLKASIAKRRVAKRKKQMTTDRAAKRKAERQIRAAAKSKTTGRSLKKTTAEPTTATTEEDDNDLAGWSVEDFMNEEFLQSSDDESEDEDRKIKGVGKASKASKTSKATKTTPNDDDDSSDGSGDEDEMDMELLKANDPEFAKFLAKNDPAAMEFNTDDLEQASSDDEEEPEDLKVTQSGRANNTANNLNTEVLTAAKLQSLVTSTFEDYSLGGLRNIVRAFAAATHMTDVDSTVASAYHYVITSSEVYNDLMMACVSNLHLTFNHHLPTKGTTNLPTTSPKWNQLAVIVKSFLKNLLHLMAGVTDTSMLLMLTTAISSYVPYIASISLLPKRYLRELLKHWSTTSKKDLRQSSFLAIRQMAIRTPFPFVEQCMKGCYLSFVRNAKTMNEQSRSAVAMMAKCIVELLGNDLVAAYQHAFVYIRQLAVHLRNAIKHKSKDAYATIFNWQYMNCLMVWAAVISTYPAENQLHALMYPLVQIIIGTVNLVPAARYFPMRFHCVGLLNKLSAATGGKNEWCGEWMLVRFWRGVFFLIPLCLCVVLLLCCLSSSSLFRHLDPHSILVVGRVALPRIWQIVAVHSKTTPIGIFSQSLLQRIANQIIPRGLRRQSIGIVGKSFCNTQMVHLLP